MKSIFKLLDVVALLEGMPTQKLVVGQVGTIVEVINEDTFLVEFCNVKGETLATEFINGSILLQLHYELKAA